MSTAIPQPKHGRRLAFSGIALTKARNPKDSIKALSEVRDELERILIESRFFETAPFSWVGISIRYGMKTGTTTHFGAICKKDGELPLAIEIETAHMQGASLVDLKTQFTAAALKALISAAERYGLATDLVTQLSALPQTPDSPPSAPPG